MFYSRYKRESEAARCRVETSRGVITKTALGSIESVDSGVGPPVLVVHGVVGGSDHALGIVQSYLGEGFRIVGVSRSATVAVLFLKTRTRQLRPTCTQPYLIIFKSKRLRCSPPRQEPHHHYSSL